MTAPEQPDNSPQAATVFAQFFTALFNLVAWGKKNALVLSMTTMLVGGGTTWWHERRTPATAQKVDASLSNESKLIAGFDSMRTDMRQLAAAAATIMAHQSAQGAQLDIITSDLSKYPPIMRIERARQDSVKRALDRPAFSFNPPTKIGAIQ